MLSSMPIRRPHRCGQIKDQSLNDDSRSTRAVPICRHLTRDNCRQREPGQDVLRKKSINFFLNSGVM